MHDRRRRSRPAIVTLLALAALAWSAMAPLTAFAAGGISLDHITDGLVDPTQITNARDGTNRLFVVEQRGTIRVIQGGVLQPGYFMNIAGKVEDGGERGLLGLAFDPSFKTNHRLYVYYTRNGGDIVVSRFTTNAARTDCHREHGPPDAAHRAQRPEQPQRRRHGVRPERPPVHRRRRRGRGRGPAEQRPEQGRLLGKILRINVNGTGHGPYGRYSVSRSNPFCGSRPGLEEIWDYGVRNPWRISFDRGTGKLFIADVGQNRYEEIDRERAGFTGGRNYGWNAMEGMHCYTASKCPLAGDTLPNAEYSHDDGNCSITGGYVYRGPTQTALVGLYVFADYCSGRIWTIPNNGQAVNTPETLRADTDHNITSFGESENGELYAVTSAGGVYQVLAS